MHTSYTGKRGVNLLIITLFLGLLSNNLFATTLIQLADYQRFDGDRYIEEPHQPSYLIQNGSISFQFMVDSLGKTQGLISKDSSGYDAGGHFDIVLNSNGAVQFRIQNRSSSYTLISSTLVTPNKWHHVTASFGSQGAQLYLDGVLEKTNSYSGGLGGELSGLDNQEPIVLGASARISGNFVATPVSYLLTGALANFELFSEQLVLDQIQTLSQKEVIEPEPEPEPEPALVFEQNLFPEFLGNNYLELPHSDVTFINNGTVSFWVKTNKISGSQSLYSKDSSGYDGGGHIGIYLNNGKIRFRLQSKSGSYEINASTTLTISQWHQISMQFGDQGMKLFIDGQLEASKTYTGGLSGNNEPHVFGTNAWKSGNQVSDRLEQYFTGSLAAFNIFDSNKDIDSDNDGIFNLIDNDDDNDSVVDYLDEAPLIPKLLPDFDNDGIPDDVDTDDDNDTYLDVNDAFPYNKDEWLDYDLDGIGNNADTDDDNDTVLDINDAFPYNKDEWSDLDGDGTGDNSDLDIDGDTVDNADDVFPLDANESEDFDLDGIGNNADTDDDNDTVLDINDAFPYNKDEWADLDGDGTGDNSDLDIDGDTVENDNDAFPLDANESEDFDLDGIGNNADTDDDNDTVLDINDAFPYNKDEWADLDGDGTGDNSDLDIDGDTVDNVDDAFPLNPDESLDTDLDGIGNNADEDDDNDNLPDFFDALPLNANEQFDFDQDGLGNNEDLDDDNDFTNDIDDALPLNSSEQNDSDLDGIGDNSDIHDNSTAWMLNQPINYVLDNWSVDYFNQGYLFSSETVNTPSLFAQNSMFEEIYVDEFSAIWKTKLNVLTDNSLIDINMQLNARADIELLINELPVHVWSTNENTYQHMFAKGEYNIELRYLNNPSKYINYGSESLNVSFSQTQYLGRVEGRTKLVDIIDEHTSVVQINAEFPAEPVDIILEPSEVPVVLILSSNEHAKWKLSNPHNVEIKAIITSGDALRWKAFAHIDGLGNIPLFESENVWYHFNQDKDYQDSMLNLMGQLPNKVYELINGQTEIWVNACDIDCTIEPAIKPIKINTFNQRIEANQNLPLLTQTNKPWFSHAWSLEEVLYPALFAKWETTIESAHNEHNPYGEQFLNINAQNTNGETTVYIDGMNFNLSMSENFVNIPLPQGLHNLELQYDNFDHNGFINFQLKTIEPIGDLTPQSAFSDYIDEYTDVVFIEDNSSPHGSKHDLYIEPTDKPVSLILSSAYEVQWNIINPTNAEIRAVVISSTGPMSNVTGTGTAPIYQAENLPNYVANSDPMYIEEQLLPLIGQVPNALYEVHQSVALNVHSCQTNCHPVLENIDSDYDGVFDFFDKDDDDDGVLDVDDAFPLFPWEQYDTDNDGMGNNEDLDDDNDSVEDTFDAFPLNAQEQFDTDLDGIGNFADTDDDNDGHLDNQDNFSLDSTEWADIDLDGIGDNQDLEIGQSPYTIASSQKAFELSNFKAAYYFNDIKLTEQNTNGLVASIENAPFYGLPLDNISIRISGDVNVQENIALDKNLFYTAPGMISGTVNNISFDPFMEDIALHKGSNHIELVISQLPEGSYFEPIYNINFPLTSTTQSEQSISTYANNSALDQSHALYYIEVVNSSSSEPTQVVIDQSDYPVTLLLTSSSYNTYLEILNPHNVEISAIYTDVRFEYLNTFNSNASITTVQDLSPPPHMGQTDEDINNHLLDRIGRIANRIEHASTGSSTLIAGCFDISCNLDQTTLNLDFANFIATYSDGLNSAYEDVSVPAINYNNSQFANIDSSNLNANWSTHFPEYSEPQTYYIKSLLNSSGNVDISVNGSPQSFYPVSIDTVKVDIDPGFNDLSVHLQNYEPSVDFELDVKRITKLGFDEAPEELTKYIDASTAIIYVGTDYAEPYMDGITLAKTNQSVVLMLNSSFNTDWKIKNPHGVDLKAIVINDGDQFVDAPFETPILSSAILSFPFDDEFLINSEIQKLAGRNANNVFVSPSIGNIEVLPCADACALLPSLENTGVILSDINLSYYNAGMFVSEETASSLSINNRNNYTKDIPNELLSLTWNAQIEITEPNVILDFAANTNGNAPFIHINGHRVNPGLSNYENFTYPITEGIYHLEINADGYPQYESHTQIKVSNAPYINDLQSLNLIIDDQTTIAVVDNQSQIHDVASVEVEQTSLPVVVFLNSDQVITWDVYSQYFNNIKAVILAGDNTQIQTQINDIPTYRTQYVPNHLINEKWVEWVGREPNQFRVIDGYNYTSITPCENVCEFDPNRDSDLDGYIDTEDAFPFDPNEHADHDLDGIGNNADLDDDNDGHDDLVDLFPYNKDEWADNDLDGIGNNTDLDDDNDGHDDLVDLFPFNKDEWADNDLDGIGNNVDLDDDNDTVPDTEDAFPFDKDESKDFDLDGTGNNADLDDDNDGHDDLVDLFPFNKDEWADNDLDGIGNNADLDDDNDTVPDTEDAFPFNKDESKDFDLDGIGNNADLDDDNDGHDDLVDLFPFNKDEWADNDLDGIGNNADLDDDNDTVPDTEDAFPFDKDESKDFDLDGIGNNADLDDDNDGHDDLIDLFPFNKDEWADNDLDGIGNNDDNDGMPDVWENEYSLNKNDKNDAVLNLDSDTLNNLEEYLHGSDPTMGDTDLDTKLDHADAFPRDPNEWLDTDGDLIGNNTDNNDDNDLFLDSDDPFPLDPSKPQRVKVTLHDIPGLASQSIYSVNTSGLGDLNHDGFDDVILGRGSSNSAKVYSGYDASLMYDLTGPESSYFGELVVNIGDINADLVNDFAVSAPYAGKVFVYSGATGNEIYVWSGSYSYGESLSAGGDINNDGVPDVLIGSPKASVESYGSIYSRAGKMEVRSGSDGTVLHELKGYSSNYELGSSASGIGDYNSDGYDDFAVKIGKHLITYRSGYNNSELRRFDKSIGYDLGYQMINIGDRDNDGRDDLLVSDPGGSTTSPGYIHYIYTGTMKLETSRSGASYSRAGKRLANAGDFDGDGINDYLMSLDSGDEGKAWLVSGSNGEIIFEFLPQSGDIGYGYGLDLAGDVNNDGQPDFIFMATNNGRAEIVTLLLDSDSDGIVDTLDGFPMDDTLQ